MKKLKFSIQIDSTKENTWKALWDDKNYRNWTSVFSEGSHAVSNWKEGSRVLFLDGKGEGIFSEIEKLVPNTLMSFKHLGVVKEGKEQPATEETKSWAGAMENYMLSEEDGKTRLVVEMDITDDFADYFGQTFPKALEKIKEIAEKI